MDPQKLLSRVAGVKVLVVGDVMLDHYRIADATRISPEAPVPVLLGAREEYRLGGAAAVAAMCVALGAETRLLGVVGLDRGGEIVRELVELAGVRSLLVAAPYPRPTTVKERICGVASGRHRQQLARIDTECTSPIPPSLEGAIVELVRGMAPPDVILMADYAKGVLTAGVVRACVDTGGMVIVDPPRDGEWGKYQGVACIVPNRQEANGALAREIQLRCQSVAAVVKLDEEGCQVSWVQETGDVCEQRIAARLRVVHDVTGAGDNFLAVLGCARGLGISWPVAAELANVAAGLQVERHGCVPVTLTELQAEVEYERATIAGPGRDTAVRGRGWLAEAG